MVSDKVQRGAGKMVYCGGWSCADYLCCGQLEGTLKDTLTNLSVLEVGRSCPGEVCWGYEQSCRQLS